MELADRLKKAMHDCDEISQYALASKAKVPQPTINRILKGVSREPKRSTLYKLADTLGVSRDWLVSEVGGQYAVAARPPTLDEAAWRTLSVKQRALIEHIANQRDDAVIDALQAVIAINKEPQRTVNVSERRKSQTIFFGQEDRRKRKDG